MTPLVSMGSEPVDGALGVDGGGGSEGSVIEGTVTPVSGTEGVVGVVTGGVICESWELGDEAGVWPAGGETVWLGTRCATGPVLASGARARLAEV